MIFNPFTRPLSAGYQAETPPIDRIILLKIIRTGFFAQFG